MSANLQVAAPSKVEVYTLNQVDEQLFQISQLLPYCGKVSRNLYMQRADKWLDKRIEICPPHLELNQ